LFYVALAFLLVFAVIWYLSLTASVLCYRPRFLLQAEIFRCPCFSSVPARIFVLNLFLSEQRRQELALRRSPRLGFQSSVCVSKGAARFLRPCSPTPATRRPFSFLPSIQFFWIAEGLFAGPPLPIVFAPASVSSPCPGACLRSRSTCRCLIFGSPSAGVRSATFSAQGRAASAWLPRSAIRFSQPASFLAALLNFLPSGFLLVSSLSAGQSCRHIIFCSRTVCPAAVLGLQFVILQVVFVSSCIILELLD
jgi:hypothetical protein